MQCRSRVRYDVSGTGLPVLSTYGLPNSSRTADLKHVSVKSQVWTLCYTAARQLCPSSLYCARKLLSGKGLQRFPAILNDLAKQTGLITQYFDSGIPESRRQTQLSTS